MTVQKFYTVDDIGTWIANNVEGKTQYRDVVDATNQFIALQLVNHMQAVYTPNDLADLIINGIPPLDRHHINTYLFG